MKTIDREPNLKKKIVFPFILGVIAIVTIIGIETICIVEFATNKIIITTISATTSTKMSIIIETIYKTTILATSQPTHNQGVEIAIAILFREGKSMLNHKSNYIVGLVALRTIPIEMEVRVEELVVTLKRLKLAPKQMIRFVARVAWSMAKSISKLKEKMRFLEILGSKL